MFFVYEVLFHIALVLGFPVLLARPRFRERVNERIGRWDPIVFDRLAGGPILWIHCASVGEVQAARPLVNALLDDLPGYRVLVTTMTVTGLKQAETAFGKRVVVSLIPLDSKLFLGRVFRRIKPAVVLVFETELWPQFLRMAREGGAKIALVNGRISARSFPRYQKIRSFMATTLSPFDAFFMGDGDSAQRITALGADASRVKTLGNVKWAADDSQVVPRKVPGWEANARVLLAGSTHPGEEEQMLDIYEDLRQYYPDLKLILAPRHPQRVPDVEKLLKARKFAFAKRTEGPLVTPEVFLLDTVGELRSFFPAATLVVLGGSFVTIGGHNVLEPAAAGVPVIYGPHMQNFEEIAAKLESRGGSLRTADWRAAAKTARELLADPMHLRGMGEAGRALVTENKRVLARYRAELRALVGGAVRA